MNWRTQMKEQRKLKGEGSKLLYQRMKLLMEIEKDGEFITWCDDNGTDYLTELENEVADVGYDYVTLKSVMDHYPSEEEWSKRLQVLIAEIIDGQKKTREPSDRKSWKQIAEERMKEIERLGGELNQAAARISELEKVIGLMTSGIRPRESAMA